MKHIDIKKILKTRESKFFRNLPDFIYTFFENIIRQKEINLILDKYTQYEGVEWINMIITDFNLNLQIEGKENLPKNGKCFFVANHAFGLADGLTITKIIGEKYGKIKFIGNQVFSVFPNLKSLTLGINMYKNSARENLVALNKAYKSDVAITHFPNGDVSRIYKGKIQDNIWHKSFITKAISEKRNVVPIHFYGRNSWIFYFIFILRKMFFIKAEIETVLLPSELFKKRGKIIKVKIGKPISYKTFDKSMSHIKWAQKVKEIVYDL